VTPPSSHRNTATNRVMKQLIAILLGVTALSAAPAQQSQTFTGTITDEMCAGVGHAPMRMGPTDAECTTLCVMSHGTRYVLEDGKNVYVLSDQKTPERFAALRVRVIGTLDAKTSTIRVESIAEAK
jgi:hypothetical protein